jgi:hypothetical protein
MMEYSSLNKDIGKKATSLTALAARVACIIMRAANYLQSIAEVLAELKIYQNEQVDLTLMVITNSGICSGRVDANVSVKQPKKPGPKPSNLSPPGMKRKGVFGTIKRKFGIPNSQQPKTTPGMDRRGNPIPGGRDYDFGDGNVIRDHPGGNIFPEDPSQNWGRHFNDPDGGHWGY